MASRRLPLLHASGPTAQAACRTASDAEGMRSTAALPYFLPGDAGPGEVVAGLATDGSAAAVAEVAVRWACERRGRVRFLQLLPEGLSTEARADTQAATFTTALRALRALPPVQAIFEAPSGDPTSVLVARSRGAIGLVVGAGATDPDDAGGVAGYCRAHAGCTVRVVTADEVRALGP